MRNKLLIYGGAALAVVMVALVATTVFTEKLGVSEILVQKGVVLDRATLQEALANAADCAGFEITEVKALGEGRMRAIITGMRGECCLNPAKTALAKVSGLEKVEVMLSRKSDL
ncbi:hypothetical protein MYX84_04220 [Acidobacteria bacterium AH-259-O06]|nr:hypothetical protein [Acidobacteria bacterium AH-259-L09]MDA2929148.1 hypothetical protein [Acidobacteria bacterium AH-259-O06]